MALVASCREDDHRDHLCQLVALETPVQELKPLIRNAKFICRFCGRAAAEANRLCRPEPLD